MPYVIKQAPQDSTQKHYEDRIRSGKGLSTARAETEANYNPELAGTYATKMLEPMYQQIYKDTMLKAMSDQAGMGVGLRGQVARDRAISQYAAPMAGQVAGYQLQTEEERRRALQRLLEQQYGAIKQGATGAFSPTAVGYYER